MLVLYREQQRWEDRYFREFPSFLGSGDCLTVNNSRVLASRLFGSKESTGAKQTSAAKVEVLLVEPVPEDAREWTALVRPGKKLPVGEVIRFDDHLSAEIIARGERGAESGVKRCVVGSMTDRRVEGIDRLAIATELHEQPTEREARVPGAEARIDMQASSLSLRPEPLPGRAMGQKEQAADTGR